MTTINIYLNFNGNSEEAFNYYKSILGGEIVTIQRFKDNPEAGQIPPADANKMMHISNSLESKGQKLVIGNNFQDKFGVQWMVSYDAVRK